jgi:hypothetical protein
VTRIRKVLFFLVGIMQQTDSMRTAGVAANQGYFASAKGSGMQRVTQNSIREVRR